MQALTRCHVHLLSICSAASACADGVRWPAQLPFDLNSRGAAETDATLRVRKHSRVFALGDVSGIDPLPADSALPATAQVPTSARTTLPEIVRRCCAGKYVSLRMCCKSNARRLKIALHLELRLHQKGAGCFMFCCLCKRSHMRCLIHLSTFRASCCMTAS